MRDYMYIEYVFYFKWCNLCNLCNLYYKIRLLLLFFGLHPYTVHPVTSVIWLEEI